MTELGAIFSRLGLEQYLDVFLTEGFESWKTVLDITESDLDALGVKLGHRRKLQREISNSRIYFADQHSPPPGGEGGSGRLDEKLYYSTSSGKNSGGQVEKRKYQRHPKADKYAPERPSSAYVIFSNKIREELKVEDLSFSDIAKKVGERWQLLLGEEKERYETQALSAKEKYHAELLDYKKTEQYHEYAKYLADFKAKNATMSDGKRRRSKAEPGSTKNARGGDLEAKDSSTRRASASSVTHERRGDDANPGVSHIGGHTLSPSGSVSITMAPPFPLEGHDFPWAPMSSGQVSPIRIGRPNYSTTIPVHVARAQQYGDPLVSRGAGQPLGQSHSAPYQHTHAGGSSQGPLESLRDLATQSSRHGRRPSARSSATAASVSSMSSTLSSSVATQNSSYADLGSMDDVKPQRSLPPIATVGLDPLSKPTQFDPGGSAMFNSSSQLPSSQSLPPPSPSPFLSASSSGKQHITPDLGGGA